MDDQELKQFFSRVADRYNQCALDKIGYVAHERLPKRLMELHQAKRDGESQSNSSAPLSVIDLACGTGLCSKLLFEAGCEVIGVDFSPGMLEWLSLIHI